MRLGAALPDVLANLKELRRIRWKKHHPVGNILERNIVEIWTRPEYVAFRKRLQEFNFSPCTYCGGCLWAQGIIRYS